MADDKVSSRNEWIFGQIRNPLEDKPYMLQSYILQMLNKTTRMFKYNNLPETIPQKDLEILLQVNGSATITEVNGNLYAFRGGLGGIPNAYYLPTLSVVSNPYLKFNKNLEIGKECEVILNDNFYQGLMPLLSKYGNLLVEAEISLKQAIINARVPALIQADNDNTYSSAVEFFKKVVEGKEYGIIASKEFYDGIRSHDFYKQAYIKDLIESIQYIKGSAFNEIGLNAAFNMKREAINEAEATLNEDILYPTIDTMLECRKLGVDRVNKMYDTNITVELDSVWLQNRIHEDLVLDMQEAEIDALENTDKEENVDEGNRDSNTATD